MVLHHALDVAVGPKLVGLGDGETRPFHISPKPITHMRRQPHVDGHKQDADAAGAGDGDDVVEAFEDFLVVVAGGGLQHEGSFFTVTEKADDVEPCVTRLVEHFGDLVLAQAVDGGAGGRVAGDGGGLADEGDPGWVR